MWLLIPPVSLFIHFTYHYFPSFLSTSNQRLFLKYILGKKGAFLQNETLNLMQISAVANQFLGVNKHKSIDAQVILWYTKWECKQ